MVFEVKAFVFCRLEHMITTEDLQPLEGASILYLFQSTAYHSFQAQLFHAWLHDAIKTLTKDSELLKSTKATHSKEVKNLKAKIAKLNASLAEERESASKLTKELKSAREEALREFKESETFHEEAMAHAGMHARIVVDKCLVSLVGKQFLLDLGEADYGLGFQDAQKEIYELLKVGKDVNANASMDIIGDEISMDDAYLNSSTNLNFVVGMDRNPVPTLAKDGQGDTVATEEEDPSAAL
nr:MAP7 domain-containing protein 1-like [Ipomoea batatas]